MQGRGDYRGNWLALYAVTLALELPVMLARYVAAWIVAAICLKATGSSVTGAETWAKLAAIAPTLWSIAALVNPSWGSRWWQERMGGREASRREHEAYEDARQEIEDRGTMLLPSPARWFVVDEQACNAAVCGNTLMLSRGLLESRHLPAVLAHELGHLQGIDARLTAAVNRLVINLPEHPQASLEAEASPGRGVRAAHERASRGPEVMIVKQETHGGGALTRLLHWTLGTWIALMRGGLGLRLLAPAWGGVWREQEYEADLWAARAGMADELADFLEVEALANDHSIPWVSLTNHTHPSTELRIDRLRRLGGRFDKAVRR
jgi:Zn-dependent protease with chaperone function